MSSRIDSPAAYIIVLVILLLLTCLTVGISFFPLDRDWHLFFGLAIGVCKASLVALFYMHLIHSRAGVWSVVCVSIFWLTVVLGALTYVDYVTRSWIPYVPGH
ncbi:MAG TPA: cytochrome C oxidase subunit IV family protein [Lacipirellulaceae bacterium]|nr:cytochrome C oxidase subunit IV family protein [Lacipirellulaceae bacterium]